MLGNFLMIHENLFMVLSHYDTLFEVSFVFVCKKTKSQILVAANQIITITKYNVANKRWFTLINNSEINQTCNVIYVLNITDGIDHLGS